MTPSGPRGGGVDRRIHTRLDVIGRLRGTFDTSATAHLLNIGQGGALLASPVRLASHAIHTVALSLGGYEFRLEIKVRHICRAVQAETPMRFEIGVEFVNAPETLHMVLAET